jgi:hypothetical protein
MGLDDGAPGFPPAMVDGEPKETGAKMIAAGG